MFQKGLPPELGKSPNKKTKPVITNQYSNTLTNTLTNLISVISPPRDQPAPIPPPRSTVTRLEDK